MSEVFLVALESCIALPNVTSGGGGGREQFLPIVNVELVQIDGFFFLREKERVTADGRDKIVSTRVTNSSRAEHPKLRVSGSSKGL